MKDFKLSTESYKGVRDFYPEDLFIQNYIFDKWKEEVEKFGYEQYDASILESADLYKAKTGEEIVNEQTYTFTDRADREVTLRPEMTPTLARMVAKKQKELSFPIRWYSIPNLFRYEKPQRGRLREHFQLNVDVFGIETLDAEKEVLSMAYRIMKAFGAKDKDFTININSRKIINDLYQKFDLDENTQYKLSKVIDKKTKISKDSFEKAIEELLGDKTKDFLSQTKNSQSVAKALGEDNDNLKEIIDLIETLGENGIKNVSFDPFLMRGFDYYTGIVFEVFDTDKENNRSLFGGGRYDELLAIFDKDKIPAFGFGMGDVTIRDFLETHGLIPKYVSNTSVLFCNVGKIDNDKIITIANKFRVLNVKSATYIGNKKVGDQIKYAEKHSIPYVICVGENELETGEYELKRLSDGKTIKGDIKILSDIVLKNPIHIKPVEIN